MRTYMHQIHTPHTYTTYMHTCMTKRSQKSTPLIAALNVTPREADMTCTTRCICTGEGHAHVRDMPVPHTVHGSMRALDVCR